MRKWFTYMNDEVKSAARILEILELLARSSASLALRDVISELGFPKSSTHALLQTLVSRGYATRDESERYSLHEACRGGPGWLGGGDAHLIAIAQPVMEQLRDITGESVFLGVRERDGRVKTICKVVSLASTRYDADLGSLIPAHCTAMGRVLLAFWEERLANEYIAHERMVRHTEFTVVNRREIRQIVENVRAEGVAICNQELDLGGSGVAAPVWDASGHVVAALDLATVTSRFDQSKENMVTSVIRSAAIISKKLGAKGLPG
jgi:DNA-binding IclR family transcriptional regulator